MRSDLNAESEWLQARFDGGGRACDADWVV